MTTPNPAAQPEGSMTTEYPPEAEVRRLRIIVPILERMHPATLRWLAHRLRLVR